MKFLKKAFAVVIVLVVIAALVGLLLPSHYKVERSIAVMARTDAVYPQIANLKRWPEWSAWNQQKFPQMKWTYSGPESGAGAHTSWDDPSGHGEMTITKADPSKGIEYDLDFDRGKYRSSGVIAIAPEAGGVKLTWTNEGDLGMNPVNRYFGLLMDKFMGPDFETGLANLKARAEKK